MTSTPFEAPDCVIAQGTVNVKHSFEDLTTHICATKRWEQVTDGPHRGSIISIPANGKIIAPSFPALVEMAKREKWIRDLQSSRHIYWELIPTSW